MATPSNTLDIFKYKSRSILGIRLSFCYTQALRDGLLCMTMAEPLLMPKSQN